ncbi:hypothetical protein, partial [Devosia sp.]|uniref:hypothetical protein n=1 Tax=Devosia sp. TaxID=1871048 RepID=UPI001AC6E313
CQRRITLNNAMSITPQPPLKPRGARVTHGSNLDGKIPAYWVSSQWQSTNGDLQVFLSVFAILRPHLSILHIRKS